MKITCLVILLCSSVSHEVLGCGWGVVPSVPGPLPPIIGPPGPGGKPSVILPDFGLPTRPLNLDLTITEAKWEFMNAILRQFNNRKDLLVLSSYDLNGDGIVHVSEILEKLEITDEETRKNVNKAFTTADHNRDSALSCQEFYWAIFWKPKMREAILRENPKCREPARQKSSASSTTTTKSTSKAVQEASSTTSHHYRGDDEGIMKGLPPGLHGDVQFCLKEHAINDQWDNSFINAVACVGNKQEQMYTDLKDDLHILIEDLKKQKNNLMLEVDQLQQNIFRYDLVIEGITEPFATTMFKNISANKEMKKLGEAELGVISVAAELGVNLTKDSIEYAKRTGSRSRHRNRRRAILVRFSCLSDRNALHHARKRVANDSNIKIKRHLTHRRKRLLKKVKQKKPLVQKAWVNDGNIFVLTNNYDVMEVHSLDDLNKYEKQSH